MQDRVAGRLDYSLEAAAQDVFATAFADDPEIVVPRPLAHTERALVTTWLESDSSLAQIITDGTQAERDRYGEAYVRFLFAGPSRAGMLHADPHPGNFRIMPDGRLGVVDFGAVARLPDGLPLAMGRLLRRAVDDDYDGVLEGLREEGFLKSKTDLDAETIARYIGPFVEPAQVERFAFSREWMRARDAAGQRSDGRRHGHCHEDQPPTAVPADPPGVDRRHRGAEPARCHGPVQGDSRRVATRVL
ncbi:AarF/UbiB family protein [Aeromicrobium sp. UC242_57]|uniref:AarF/UbiB family protein n=1 Tax=Aeromicrobium sp. UC242_57 TaxID=3374624 RepID=UPI0037933056